MRNIVVTGANKGIGLAIVTTILEEHADTAVFLGARSAQRGQAAREGLLAQHPDWVERVTVLPLDVTDTASVTAAAARVRAAVGAGGLYGLVNNAGINGPDPRAVLDVNTYGVKRVTEALLPLLDPTQGRVVMVSSASGPNFVSACAPRYQALFTANTITWAQLEEVMNAYLELTQSGQSVTAHGFGGRVYGLSKAVVNSYVMLLARQHPALTINGCTPGFVETDMTRPYAAAQGRAPSEMGMKSPAQGARPSVFLLFAPLAGNGWYYGSDAQRSPLDRYRSPGDPPYTGE